MAKTCVGIFDDEQAARGAEHELQSLGITPAHIRVMNGAEAAAWAEANDRQATLMERIHGWFSSLFDDESDRHHADSYAEAYRRGHTIVVVDVEDPWAEHAALAMQRYRAVDVECRRDQWRTRGYQGFDRTARPFSAEERAQELAMYPRPAPPCLITFVHDDVPVGRRVSQRGGVHIHSYAEDLPVREVLQRREDRIEQRRASDRPVTTANRAFERRVAHVSVFAAETRRGAPDSRRAPESAR